MRSQLAAAALSVKNAFDKMNGNPFVVETKFDGEQMKSYITGNWAAGLEFKARLVLFSSAEEKSFKQPAKMDQY